MFGDLESLKTQILVESFLISRDQAVRLDGITYIHPSTMMVVKHGRTPLWTRHMKGVIESERDRRRKAKSKMVRGTRHKDAITER